MGFKYAKYMIKSKNVCSNQKKALPLQSHLKKECLTFLGKMAEWSIAAVLKTVDLNGSGGSNPSLSATQKEKSVCPSLLEQADFFFCVARMPSADFRDYAEIPLFRQGCRWQTLGITHKFLSFLKDAICILIGFSRWYCLGNAGALESLYVKSVCPSLLEQADFFFCVARMPLADFRDYVEIPLFRQDAIAS